MSSGMYGDLNYKLSIAFAVSDHREDKDKETLVVSFKPADPGKCSMAAVKNLADLMIGVQPFAEFVLLGIEGAELVYSVKKVVFKEAERPAIKCQAPNYMFQA